jgi:putative transposase
MPRLRMRWEKKYVSASTGRLQAVAHLVSGHGMAGLLARRVFECCRTTIRYEVILRDDLVLRGRLRELAREHRRFGDGRLYAFLRRESHEVIPKRLFGIYSEKRLHVRRRGKRKRVIGIRASTASPMMPNQR